MEFLELIIRCAFKGLDLALRAGRGEKSYANWSIPQKKKKCSVSGPLYCTGTLLVSCSVTQCRPIRAGCTSLWTGAAGSVITAAFADK